MAGAIITGLALCCVCGSLGTCCYCFFCRRKKDSTMHAAQVNAVSIDMLEQHASTLHKAQSEVTAVYTDAIPVTVHADQPGAAMASEIEFEKRQDNYASPDDDHASNLHVHDNLSAATPISGKKTWVQQQVENHTTMCSSPTSPSAPSSPRKFRAEDHDLTQDPSGFSYLKLKHWLQAAGCPKEELSTCVDKHDLLRILPRFAPR